LLRAALSHAPERASRVCDEPATTRRAYLQKRIPGARGYKRPMKQHSGAEIVTIMTEMPAELIAALQDAHAEHAITEHEARWWGYLQVARTGSYEGETFVIKVMSTGDDVVQAFLPYVLAGRASDLRVGLVRKVWPECGYEPTG